MQIELTDNEVSSLKEFIERNNEPCKDCNRDKDCGIYKIGKCIAKNVENIHSKLN